MKLKILTRREVIKDLPYTLDKTTFDKQEDQLEISIINGVVNKCN